MRWSIGCSERSPMALSAGVAADRPSPPCRPVCSCLVLSASSFCSDAQILLVNPEVPKMMPRIYRRRRLRSMENPAP